MNELVSIVVLCYNSEEYVTETLDSILRQGYSPLELIITDDASTDQTLTVCRNWLDAHGQRFINTRLLRVDKNTGTSRNANRGVRASSGAWIKVIAGDDLLQTDCILSFINFVQSNDAQVVVSSMTPFRDEGNERKFGNIKNYSNELFYRPSTTSRQQFLISLFRYGINSPTLFMKRSAFDDVDGYDENMKIIEDMAMYFRFTLHRKKIYYLNQSTVYYRMHEASVSNSAKRSLVSEWKEIDREHRYETYIRPNVDKLALNLNRMLMKLYYKKDRLSRWLKALISYSGIRLVKYGIIQ